MTEAIQTANSTDSREESKSRVTTQDDIIKRATAAPSQPSEQSEVTQDDEQKPKPKSAQERIQQLAHARREAEMKASEAERKAQELAARLEALQAQAAPIEATQKPRRADFVSDEEYIDAMADYKAREVIAERERAQLQARQEAEQRELASNWEKRQSAAMKEIADYAEVIGQSEINIAPHVRDALLESDVGPHLAYYLALNPDEAKKLNGMRPAAAVRYMTKLEAELSSVESDIEAEKPEAEAKKTKSKAPEPITPVKAVPANTSSPSDFRSYRERRLAQKRK